MLLAACPPPKFHDTMLEFTNTSAKRVKHFMVIKVTYLIRVATRVISVIRVTRKLNAERGTLVGMGGGHAFPSGACAYSQVRNNNWHLLGSIHQ